MSHECSFVVFQKFLVFAMTLLVQNIKISLLLQSKTWRNQESERNQPAKIVIYLIDPAPGTMIFTFFNTSMIVLSEHVC